MASWQAHFAAWYLRNFLKPRLRGQRDVTRVRKLLRPQPVALPFGVRATPGEMGGVPGEWVEADNPKGELLYLHGGGYIASSPELHRPIPMQFALHGFRVFSPDYRLAPEHPFPAAVHDAIEAFLGMAEGDPPRPVAVAGDSAGGGLAVAMMLSLRAAARPLPKAAVLFSPWTDLAVTGDSVTRNAQTCALFTADGMKFAAGLYLGQTPATDPLASPLYGDLVKLPPMLIHVGEDETMLDDSTRLAAHARSCGVKVELKVWPVVPHSWQLSPKIPESRESVKEAARFIYAQ